MKPRRNTTFPMQAGNRVKHYSNMSDDRYGINGAFADIMDGIAGAKTTIFLQGWLFEPDVVLPIQNILRPGLTLQSQGNIEEAIVEYTRALDLNPQHDYLHYFVGSAQLQLGNFKAAQHHFRAAINLSPSGEDFYHALMLCYFNQSQYANLEKVYQQALINRVSFKTGNLLILYAEYLLKNGRISEAETLIEQASIVNPDHVNLNRLRGRLYEQQGLLVKARHVLTNYLHDKPMDAWAVIKLAHIKYRQAKSDPELQQFIDEYKEMGFCALSNQIALDLAASYLRLHQLDNAKNILLDIINGTEQSPRDAHNAYARSLLAQVHQGEGDISQALIQYQLSLDLDPHNEITLKRYTECLAAVAEDDRVKLTQQLSLKQQAPIAIASLNKTTLLKYITDHPYNIEALLRLADIYIDEDQYQEMVRCYELAMTMRPYDIDLRNTVIRALKQAGHNSLFATQHSEPPWSKQDLEERAQAIENSTPAQVFMEFADNYYAFKHSHPSLGEVLIKKALENPELIIAINLWNNQRESHQEAFLRLEAIAKEKFGLEKLPSNFHIRMVSNQGIFRSFHQKYLIVDNGNNQLNAFYGGSDLATGKFDWNEHPLVNTPDTQIWTAFGANHWQNHRPATDSDNNVTVRSGWHDIQSQVQGPASLDLAADFVSHWRAGVGGAITSHKVDERSNQAIAQHWQQVKKNVTANPVNMESSEALWNCRVVRSATKASHVEWRLAKNYENSLQLAYLHAIKNAEKFIYLETQYFSGDVQHGNSIPRALIEKICQKASRGEPFHVFMVLPICPNGDPGDPISVEPFRRTQWKLMRGMMREIEQRTGKHWNEFISFDFYAKWHGVTNRYKELRNLEDIKPKISRNEQRLLQKIKVLAKNLLQNDTPAKTLSWSQRFVSYLKRIKARRTEGGIFYRILNYFIRKFDDPVAKKNIVNRSEKNPSRILAALLAPLTKQHATKQRQTELQKRQARLNEISLIALVKQLITELNTITPPLESTLSRINRLQKILTEIQTGLNNNIDNLCPYQQLLIEINGPTRANLIAASQRFPVYVHSKFMLVDDKIMINGSANLNARSMAGKNSDSEIAILQTPQPGHEAACQREARAFRRKIWQPYFGNDLMEQLAEDGFDNPHLPDNRKKIQQRAETNFNGFASDEPGNCSTADTGLLCTWPFSKEKRQVGKLQGEHQYIPDTTKLNQSPKSSFGFFPNDNAKPTAKVVADAMQFKPFH